MSGVIPEPPGTCDCGRPGRIITVKVRDLKTRRLETGPFSKFSQPMTNKRLLKPMFQFIRWIVRCEDCLYRRQGHQELSA